MKRRSFFKSIAAVVAAVALAPEIAFNVSMKERFIDFGISEFWTQPAWWTQYYSDTYRKWLEFTLDSRLK